jgi:hypothetical protein
MGAVITAMTTSFADATLADGSRDIFSFKVTVPASSNVDYDGAALGVKLASTTFTVASTSPITLSGYKIRRVGGAAEQTVSGADEITNNASSFVMNLENIFTNGSDQSDLIVKPGETAEFIIRATVAGTGTSKSLQVSIDSVDNDVFYTHNVGSLGAFTADATTVHPLVSGLSSVSGGTLNQ